MGRDTYDLDTTLVGVRVTFCLVRESVSSITPRDEGIRGQGGRGGSERISSESQIGIKPSNTDRRTGASIVYYATWLAPPI